MFTTSDVKHRLTQQPFKPFRIVTSSGETYEVRDPDLLLVGINELTIGLAGKKDPTAYERLARVALVHVASIEDLPAKAKSSKGNGSGQQ